MQTFQDTPNLEDISIIQEDPDRAIAYLKARLEEATDKSYWDVVSFVNSLPRTFYTETYNVVWSGSDKVSLSASCVIDYQYDDIDRPHPLHRSISPKQRKSLFRDIKGHRKHLTEEEYDTARKKSKARTEMNKLIRLSIQYKKLTGKDYKPKGA